MKEQENIHGNNVTFEKQNWIGWLVVWGILITGEPDLLDGIIHFLMR